MLGIPLKTTDAKKVDWTGGLDKYVSRVRAAVQIHVATNWHQGIPVHPALCSRSTCARQAYSKAQASAHAKQFAAVGDLHRQCSDVKALRDNVSDAAGRHGSDDPLATSEAMGTLLRYYRLLCSMETRFEAHELRIHFPWHDAFDHKIKQGEADLKFERTATLFNVASLMSFVAIRQDRSDPEGIKAACLLFQQTAHVLSLLPPLVAASPWGGKQVSPDLHKSTAECLQALMLAQVSSPDLP